MSVRYVLCETASGYALFERLATDEVGAELDAVQASVQDLSKFGKAIKLTSFAPFQSAGHALENINDVSEGLCHDFLKNFLSMNLAPLMRKKEEGKNKARAFTLGVAEKNLAGTIKQELGIECSSDALVHELLRGIRLHLPKMIKQLAEVGVEKAQLGLGHSYSRAKVKFNVNRSDNMIIQASALLDELDKDVNTFSMRVREWYSWHFPELIKIVPDNLLYAKLARFIKDKSKLTEEHLPGLTDILTGDDEKAAAVLNAAKKSMGMDISEIDLLNIESFAERCVSLAEYRKDLQAYLVEKMSMLAPNLSELIGETVGARLIRHAGSLTNLSKYPASTVQILGAEKALFRALKTKGNTPKYGLIYHSTFIGRAGQKNKGRISRYLANKCSIASRIDCFTDKPSNLFGEALRSQVEERLKFYETGATPQKNVDVMDRVLKNLGDVMEDTSPKKKRKRAEIAPPEEEEDEANAMDVDEKKASKKKEKKAKKTKDASSVETAPAAPVEEEEKTKKKEKKKAKSTPTTEDATGKEEKKKKKKKSTDA